MVVIERYHAVRHGSLAFPPWLPVAGSKSDVLVHQPTLGTQKYQACHEDLEVIP